MKNYILRAPETDRKKVPVPTLLTDLDDYAEGHVTGKAVTDPYDSAGNTGASITQDLNEASELVACTSDGTGLTVTYGGLFVITASVLWIQGGVPAAPTPRASTLLRSSGVAVGGVGIGTLTNAPTDIGPDSGTFMQRLAAGDQVTIVAASTDGASEGRLIAQLSLVKVAP